MPSTENNNLFLIFKTIGVSHDRQIVNYSFTADKKQ